MRGARSVTAAGLAAVLGTGLLAGCRTGDGVEPADERATSTATVTATVTTGPSIEPSAAPDEEPTAAASPAVNGPNTITSPLAGEAVAGPTVTIAGQGTGFEGTLLYRVTRAGGTDALAEGFTMAGANGEVGPYSFDVTLDPGEYVVQVWEPGMGEGDTDDAPRNLVEVTFTVS